MIDRETQQRIKDAANIVEVVGDYVKLTRRGANYMGLCPFHNERTPSFSVSPRKNFCHCFSCKKGGSPVNFLMEKEGIGYTEALLMLAKKYNIPVQERELSDEEKARMSERESMLVASEWAMNFFHDALFNSEEGRDIGLAYLYSRGITDEAIRQFKLGYSPDRSDALLSAAKREGFDLDVFRKIGLIGTSQQGRDYDRFRGRVMFPIRNASGKPVAFGGRALKGEPAKYINSPETLLYKKSNELYGIFEAKSEVMKLDRVFLMEGYLDVIGSRQAGLRNAVASSGTALTESQIALIHRFTDNVTLIYDGDAAGIKASLRGIDMLLSQKLHVKVLLLPDGEDPDSFARKCTPEEFRSYIEEHQTDFIRYKLDVLLKNAAGNPQEISEAVHSVVSSIASVPDEIERISYVKECASAMGIEEKVISRQVAQMMLTLAAARSQRSPYQDFSSSVRLPEPSVDATTQSPPQEKEPPTSNFAPQELEILKYCVRFGFLPMDETQSVLEYVSEELEADSLHFSHPLYSRIFYLLMERLEAFRIEAERYSEDIEAVLKADRERFLEEQRSSGGSLARLQKEEEKYLASEMSRREEMMRSFAVSFSVDYLISHEDDAVRAMVNPMVAERHSLSAIYRREGSAGTPPEEDRLAELVPRAISELRSEFLNSRIKELRAQVSEALRNGDADEQQRLLSELSRVLYVRSRIAENLGERILSPR